MSDEKKASSGGVRRVGEKDRKARLESSGPLFPPNAPPPPTLPEDMPDSDEPAEPLETAPAQPESEANALSPMDDDAAALLAELESDIEFDAQANEEESDDEDDASPFRRPTADPYPLPAPDRFPPLPEEGPEYPPLKMPRPQAPPAPPRKGGGAKFNLLTLLFLLASCGLAAYFGFVWQNPYSPLNPFAPFTPPPVMMSQTFTPSLTFTPSPTQTPSPTLTPQPTDTATPLPTETPLEADAAGAEVTQEAGFAFSLDGGHEIFITNPDGRGACRWSSIAGTVSDANGQALNEYQIRVLGDGVDDTVISGTAAGFGPGGFELQLGNEAVDAEFAVQLLDPSGAPVSDVLTVTTSARCDWNISVLRFVQRVG
jgi:hypothetical protein